MRAIGGAVVATAVFLGCGPGNGGGGGGSGGRSAPPGTALVTVELTGQGGGHVRSAQTSIDCPGSCTITAKIGTAVALSQEADAGSVFVGWGGACSGPGACSLTVNGDVTVWANFDKGAAPPPLPTGCASLVTTAPSAVSYEIPMLGKGFSCFPGGGDATGTLGLYTQGSRRGDGTCMSCVRQRSFFFVDESKGVEKTFTAFLGSPGSREVIVQQPDGFIAVNIGPDGTIAQHLDRAGRSVSHGNWMLGTPAVKEAPLGGVVYAGDFNAQDDDFRNAPRHQACFLDQDASVRWCKDLASKGTVFGLGADALNNAIVISNGGSGSISAEWFGALDGRSLSAGAFTLIDSFVPGANTWFETAPLIGGGVAIRRVDLQNDGTGRPYTTSQWLVTVAPGATRANAAPQWLTSRPNTNMAIVRSGKAYAMLPLGAPAAVCMQMIDIVAPDGTQCGSFNLGLESGQCRTEDVTLALDGTPLQLRPRASFPGSCAYRWWPSALR